MTEPETGSDPLEAEQCDHEWAVVDASFGHEFGTELVVYDECSLCGETREHDPYYFEDLYDE